MVTGFVVLWVLCFYVYLCFLHFPIVFSWLVGLENEGVGLDGREDGEDLGGANHDQNILYKFSIKMFQRSSFKKNCFIV